MGTAGHHDHTFTLSGVIIAVMIQTVGCDGVTVGLWGDRSSQGPSCFDSLRQLQLKLQMAHSVYRVNNAHNIISQIPQ